MGTCSRWQGTIALVLLVGVSHAAWGDVTVGPAARIAGLGGAGVALLDGAASAVTVNPAALGARSGGFALLVPELGILTRGHSVTDISDAVESRGDVSTGRLERLARVFGRRDTTMLFQLGLGGVFSTGDVRFIGVGRADIAPDASFRQWAANPSVPATALGKAQVKAAAFATLPSVAYAGRVPLSGAGTEGGAELYVGARASWYKSRSIAGVVEITPGSTEATVLGNPPVESHSALGLDIGGTYRPSAQSPASYGVVLYNAVRPSLGIIRTKRVLTAGMAYRLSNGAIVVADLANIGAGGGGDSDTAFAIRTGIEYPVASGLRLRAGVSTRGRLSAGARIGGVDIAVASRMPLLIGHSITF